MCDFGLVDNFVNQIADIAWSAMEARNFFLGLGTFTGVFGLPAELYPHI